MIAKPITITVSPGHPHTCTHEEARFIVRQFMTPHGVAPHVKEAILKVMDEKFPAGTVLSYSGMTLRIQGPNLEDWMEIQGSDLPTGHSVSF